MTKTEAHSLLDAARAGALISPMTIIEALRTTGDLGRHEKAPVPVVYASSRWPYYATDDGQQPTRGAAA